MMQPPLVVDQLLEDDDLDSSDMFTEDATKSYYTSNQLPYMNRKQIRGYERSEGEIGAPFSGSDGHSDIARFPSNPRSVGLGDRAGAAAHL
eukprot:CAMPEP_0170452912 /NCGR_PEP_ID=MMETSP0123-20130129/1670_1 /TAXON_ID=182087 /ORGANISM="Favella ehrenbergii, Strain Fehren 1" /LENGTH=90 /DNA_ID=CAMNT_0010715111 /DNA_START=1773 /DNA_END=2045 /DNA_ORIENTATION=+